MLAGKLHRKQRRSVPACIILLHARASGRPGLFFAVCRLVPQGPLSRPSGKRCLEDLVAEFPSVHAAITGAIPSINAVPIAAAAAVPPSAAPIAAPSVPPMSMPMTSSVVEAVVATVAVRAVMRVPGYCSLSKQRQSGDCYPCNQKISDRHFRTYLFYRVCDPFSRPRAGNLTPPAPALAIVLSACAIIDLFLRNSTHKIVTCRKPKPPVRIHPAELRASLSNCKGKSPGRLKGAVLRLSRHPRT